MTFTLSTPSALGIDADGIIGFLDEMQRQDIELHSLAIARDGQIAVEAYWSPYAADRPHLLYSISKTWTATAAGLLVTDGLLDLDGPIVDQVGAGELEITDRWREVTLRNCLQMATGHDSEAWGPHLFAAAAATPDAAGTVDPLVTAILTGREPEAQPGTVFAYNQVATYLVGAAIREASGRSISDVLQERVLTPLGVPELPWHRTATGAELGFSGSHARTRDVLALGQAYLSNGSFFGTQVVTPEWITTATANPALPNATAGGPDWDQGYGCSLWHARHGFRGDGAFGQFMIVLPEQQLTIAITSETDEMQAVLEGLWTHLLPALGEPDHTGSTEADQRLTQRVADLQVPALPATGETPDKVVEWPLDDGLGSAYSRVRVESEGGQTIVTPIRDLDEPQVALRTTLGNGTWVESEWRGSTQDSRQDESWLGASWRMPVLGSGGWQAEGGFEAEIRMIETPHSFRVHAEPGADRARVAWRHQALMGPDPLGYVVRIDRPHD